MSADAKDQENEAPRVEISMEYLRKSAPVIIPQDHFRKMLARIKLFEMTLDVHGSIVECGVSRGESFMLFMRLCEVYQPYAADKRVIGFDTFEGFKAVSPHDGDHVKEGERGDVILEFLMTMIEDFEKNDRMSVHRRSFMVKGDAVVTIPEFIKSNPGLTISLLHIDFDIYKPMVAAFEHLVPRVTKGGIIAVDDVASARYGKGAGKALHDCVDVSKVAMKRFAFEPWLSYWRVE